MQVSLLPGSPLWAPITFQASLDHSLAYTVSPRLGLFGGRANLKPPAALHTAGTQLENIT